MKIKNPVFKNIPIEKSFIIVRAPLTEKSLSRRKAMMEV